MGDKEEGGSDSKPRQIPQTDEDERLDSVVFPFGNGDDAIAVGNDSGHDGGESKSSGADAWMASSFMPV